MLSFIAYIFKIIISLVVGFLIGHDFKSDKENNNIVLYTSLLSFTASIFSSVVLRMNTTDSHFVVGFLLFGMIYLINSFVEIFEKNDKSKLIFATLIGIIIGAGYILYSLLATVIYIYIYYNVNIFINLLSNTSSNNTLDSKVDEEE